MWAVDLLYFGLLLVMVAGVTAIMEVLFLDPDDGDDGGEVASGSRSSLQDDGGPQSRQRAGDTREPDGAPLHLVESRPAWGDQPGGGGGESATRNARAAELALVSEPLPASVYNWDSASDNWGCW